MLTFLSQETLSTHISSPRNVIYSHFFAKKRYQLAGSVITFLRRQIVRLKTDTTKKNLRRLLQQLLAAKASFVHGDAAFSTIERSLPVLHPTELRQAGGGGGSAN